MILRAPSKARRQASHDPPKVLGTSSIALILLEVLGCEPRLAQRHFHQRADQWAKGDYSSAKDQDILALELNLRWGAVDVGRGQFHEGLASLPVAVDGCKRALKLQSDLTEAEQRLIWVLVKMGKGSQALERLASLSPNSLTPALLLARGQGQMPVEHAPEAIVDLDSVLKPEPRNASAHDHRGLAHAQLGKLPAAEKDLTVAFALDTTRARASWQRGLIMERLGMQEVAKADREKAVELDPRMSFAESPLGKNMLDSLTGQGGDDAKLESFSKERG